MNQEEKNKLERAKEILFDVWKSINEKDSLKYLVITDLIWTSTHLLDLAIVEDYDMKTRGQ